MQKECTRELEQIEKNRGEEIPLPEEHFRKLGIASRPTFYRWEFQGLRILRVNDRRFIYPSDLKKFIEAKDREAQLLKTPDDDEGAANTAVD